MVLKRIKKVVGVRKGFTPRDFNTDSLGYKYVDILYVKLGRLGKILRTKIKKRITVPKGMRVILIQNHTPRVGAITITYEKRK